MKNRRANHTAIIIDADTDALGTLCTLIESHCPQVEIIASYTNSLHGIKNIKLLNPTVIFLDVEILQISGIQFLSDLKEINYHLIFTSACDKLPIEALRYNAVDYLLKPVDAEELKKAIQKVAEKTYFLSQQLQHICEIILESEKVQLPKRMAFPYAKGYKFITLKDIIFCESESNYTIIHLVAQPKFTVCKTLGEIEEVLSQSHFLRIHRSYLVNTKRIKEFVKSDGGFLIMDNSSEIPISRHKREELGEILKPQSG